ncbi:hypothetical protein Pst134EA_009126 [Puccinia striiformis f. sp. tritici]|nr:hypothetical protein Pst134EA_009126 [Puccinia striiformis f. sp. tritici]KAH9457876.1 hypothetical protein Pst134EB_010186 [Puccinia striiformis f. sp. tritici]KAH9468591.1 hypothetical protein Pst134EA_009126 [Puccinia striiformis f. sp. tritici]KAI9622315.1 hypothetical protein KEM48_007328 [Puccinia striiformis f. sp. tritici PST-130]KNE96813.1 hypothetical protein PSTG_09949 [Puccinia striiformis f. sp. tritici PST-78]
MIYNTSKKTFGGFEEIKDLTNRTFNHSTHMLEISKEQWEDLIQQENNKETTLKPSRVRNTPFPYYDIFKDISFIVNNQSNKSNITPAQSPPVILSSEQKTDIFKQILESLKKGPKTVTCISGDVWLDVAWELKLSNPMWYTES